MHGKSHAKKRGLVARGKRLIARRGEKKKQKKLHKAFREIKANPPRSLERQAERYGKGSPRYEAMRRAIAFSKAGMSRK